MGYLSLYNQVNQYLIINLFLERKMSMSINIYFYFYFCVCICIYLIGTLSLESPNTAVVSQHTGVFHSNMWCESVYSEVVTSLGFATGNESLDPRSALVHV